MPMADTTYKKVLPFSLITPYVMNFGPEPSIELLQLWCLVLFSAADIMLKQCKVTVAKGK